MRRFLGGLAALGALAAAGAPTLEALERLPWIGDGRAPFAQAADFYGDDPAPEFRAVCALAPGDGDVEVLVACAGLFEARLNGRPPKNAAATMPLWSPFDRTLYAERLVFSASARRAPPRENVLTVTLGNGFYNLAPLRFWGRLVFRDALAHGRPCFKALVLGAPPPRGWTWRNTRIVRNDVYLGETFDWARAEDRAWKPAAEVAGPKGRIVPRLAPPTVAELPVPGRATWIREGEVQVVDFGENATAIPRFLFTKLTPGRRVEVVYGERLHPDGRVNVLTQTAGQIKRGNGGPGAPALACARDVFVLGAGDCKGAHLGAEVFEPRFSWRVFRYAEVRGYDRLLEPGCAQVRRLRPALRERPSAAAFRAGDVALARLHEVCRRTFLANAVGGVQSDCPGRERLGYGGDIVATCEAYMLNWDMREFYLKTLQDFADEAAGDGWITETAPYVGIADRGFGGRAGPISWALAVPTLMDALIRHYPDVRDRALAFYPVCAREMRLVDAACPDGIVPRCIGDHEALRRAPDAVTATAHAHRFASLTAKFARMLGRADEARAFEAVAEKMRAAFAARFVKDGVVADGSQSAQAIALYLGLVPRGQVAAAEAALVRAVEAAGCAPTTGLFSTRYMLLYLSEHGRADLARKIVLHEGFPGWRHMLARGATTLWETWRESDDVYSNCHAMFGSVDEWILRFGRK